MKRLVFIICLAILCAFSADAQKRKKDVLCVYGFTSAYGISYNYTEILRNNIINGINKTARVIIIDAENEAVLATSMQYRPDENASYNDNTLLDALKKLGANYALSGHLSSLTVNSHTNDKGTQCDAKAIFQIKLLTCRTEQLSPTKVLKPHLPASFQIKNRQKMSE